MGELLGRTIDLDVTKIAHGGIAVARHEGRVVFVADAIPGERVRAIVTDDRKKSFLRADTVEVLEASEHRQPHIWDAASIERPSGERAGGAEFGHIELSHQRELKRQVIAEALERMAGIATEVTVEEVTGAEPDGTGWRTRVRLHVDPQGRPGPVAARSHTVIPVTSLPLATRELAEAAPLGERFTGHATVDVLAPSSGGVRLIVGEQKPSPIVERVGDREFRLNDSGFWQVHRGAAAALTTAVQEAIDPDRFDPSAANLDLYGGVGLLAAAVADRFGPTTRIVSVESDEAATDFASENLSDWVGARAETGRIERWLPRLAADASTPERQRFARATIVIDPPRAGAGREVVDALAAVNPAQLIYVACDPVAFARDAAFLGEHGYALERLRAFDLFPHTHHVEAVGMFAKP
jgi:tRNA/tmRNA/rRNA uracil-C5-methylase (TrmA/RlmC/RlmD family)